MNKTIIASLRTLALVPLISLSVVSHAAQDLDRVTNTLAEIFGGSKNLTVSETSSDNVFLVSKGGQFIHVYMNHDQVLFGELVSVNSQQNLTQQAKTAWTEQKINSLSDQDMVVFGSPELEKSVYVFTDVDCGYCRRFHENDVATLNKAGVKVKYLAWPRAGLGSVNHQKLEAVWCSENPQLAMTSAKRGQAPTYKQCQNKIEGHFAFGVEIGLRGTPAMILDDGTYLPGYRTAEQILKILDVNE